MKHSLSIFAVIAVLTIIAAKCHGQAPDISSALESWELADRAYAVYVNPSDSLNYLEVYYNLAGEPSVWRYYEPDSANPGASILTWVNTLTEGTFAVTREMRVALAAWEDPVFRLQFQAITSELAVTRR